MNDLEKRLAGLILGTAVGDALGLPAEGLSRDRIQRRWKGDWKMRLIFNKGMVSDDTEHAFFVGQSLLVAQNDIKAFRRGLASCLRWWFLCLPAGVGLATARSCLKLWLGVSPEHSGVFSAGNGPAMRSALLGAYFADDAAPRKEFVMASTRLTHTDPRAQTAALAIAEAVAWNFNGRHPSDGFIQRLLEMDGGDEWTQICRRLGDTANLNESIGEFARSLGLEKAVTGYAFHTVPIALYAWLRHPDDFRKALTESLDCGGDTDTVGAIVGALVGSRVGEAGIPGEWLDNIREWPRSISKMRTLASRLARAKELGGAQPPVEYWRIGVPARNLFFLAVVLGHGFRRLFPPY